MESNLIGSAPFSLVLLIDVIEWTELKEWTLKRTSLGLENS